MSSSNPSTFPWKLNTPLAGYPLALNDILLVNRSTTKVTSAPPVVTKLPLLPIPNLPSSLGSVGDSLQPATPSTTTITFKKIPAPRHVIFPPTPGGFSQVKWCAIEEKKVRAFRTDL